MSITELDYYQANSRETLRRGMAPRFHYIESFRFIESLKADFPSATETEIVKRTNQVITEGSLNNPYIVKGNARFIRAGVSMLVSGSLLASNFQFSVRSIANPIDEENDLDYFDLQTFSLRLLTCNEEAYLSWCRINGQSPDSINHELHDLDVSPSSLLARANFRIARMKAHILAEDINEKHHLQQIGRMILFRKASGYDYRLGNSFFSYAVPLVQASIYRESNRIGTYGRRHQDLGDYEFHFADETAQYQLENVDAHLTIDRLKGLSRRQIEILHAMVEYNMNQTDIAKVLGISHQRLSSQIINIRQKLRRSGFTKEL